MFATLSGWNIHMHSFCDNSFTGLQSLISSSLQIDCPSAMRLSEFGVIQLCRHHVKNFAFRAPLSSTLTGYLKAVWPDFWGVHF